MERRVTQQDIETIVGLSSDPVRRNYEISQAYADISRDFRDILGLPEANWCTFATWASATAGDFIRGDLFPDFLLGKLADNATLSHRLAGLMAQSAPERLLRGHQGLRGIVESICERVAIQIAEGNLKVFEELAPEFVELIDLYEGDDKPTAAQVRKHFKQRLRPGPSQHDGQARLVEAFEAYARAAVERNPERRAQLTLYGSVVVGFHEQIRLQPAIAGGLDAPFQTAIEEVVDLISTWALVPAVRRVFAAQLRDVANGRLRGVVRTVHGVYRDAVTELGMTLRLPTRTVRLGDDVKYGRTGLPRAMSVEAIVPKTPELALLMEGFGALRDDNVDSGARDWTRMTDRMPFILDLFRSTQHKPELFGEPLTPRERASLARGVTPTDEDRLAAE